MAKIAVIGSGIAGLSAAFLLSRRHDVTLYERQPRPGGHSRTIDVRYFDRTIAVDTGFIVFNERNYPNLSALFRYLGVAVQVSSMSFALTAQDGSIEWGAENLRTVFAQPRNLLRPKFLKLFAEVMRFNRTAVSMVLRCPNLTVGELLARMRLGAWFRDYYLLPLASAIWSTPAQKILDYPANSLIQFFDNHNLLSMRGQPQWMTVVGGARVYVERLLAHLGQRAKIGCGVSQITRSPLGVEVVDDSLTRQIYDEVVFACHSDEALALLADATESERDALGSIKYQPNLAVLHCDTRFMPKRKACWSSWVYHSASQQDPAATSVTYWMNRLQNIDPAYPLFVTLNPNRPIEASQIFDRFECSHPVMDRAAVDAQPKLWAMQGERHTWFCGAYLGHGFHEDGLVSAIRVSERLGATVPWLSAKAAKETKSRPLQGQLPTTVPAGAMLALEEGGA